MAAQIWSPNSSEISPVLNTNAQRYHCQYSSMNLKNLRKTVQTESLASGTKARNSEGLTGLVPDIQEQCRLNPTVWQALFLEVKPSRTIGYMLGVNVFRVPLGVAVGAFYANVLNPA
jgi:hypothetical protein